MTLVRAFVVLVTIVGALGVAMAVATWGSPALAGVLVLGTVPAVWGGLRFLERRMGRELWQFDAP